MVAFFVLLHPDFIAPMSAAVTSFCLSAFLLSCTFRAFSNASLFFKELKVALSGLRKFLAIESPLKMIKNTFYFTSKAPFILKIFKFLS